MIPHLSSLPALRLDRLFDRIGHWWEHATAYDFGCLALAVVICMWFLSHYYGD
jgi:hypothetical protein